MSGRVLVVGSVNVDLVIQGERLPLPGETVMGGTFKRFHGGKGGNQAVAAARLGVPVMLVAALGDDEFAGDARAALAREGVGTDVLVTLEHTATGVALILVDGKAENQISVAPGANAGLTATHVRQALGPAQPAPGRRRHRHRRDPDRRRARGPAPRPRGRCLDRAQPGARRRDRPDDALPRRRRDPEPRRARPPRRRRRPTLRSPDHRAPRTRSARRRRSSRRRARARARARRSSYRWARPVRCSCRATASPWTSRRRRSRPSMRPGPVTPSTAHSPPPSRAA